MYQALPNSARIDRRPPPPTLTHQPYQRQQGVAPPRYNHAEPDLYREPGGTREDFGRLLTRVRERRLHAGGGTHHQPDHKSTNSSATATFRPSTGSRNDPDYYEKKELLLRIETMSSLGFTFPRGLDYTTPVEDLKSEISRKEVAMNTISDVDYVIGWIKTITEGIQGFNKFCGTFLPLSDYSDRVNTRIHTPRFRYAIYLLLLRYKRRGSGSPWKEVIMVLLLPLIECIVIKVVQYFARDRLPVGDSIIEGGIRGIVQAGEGLIASKSKIPDVDGVTVNVGPRDDGMDPNSVRTYNQRPNPKKHKNKKKKQSPPMDEPSNVSSTIGGDGTAQAPEAVGRGRRMPRPTDNYNSSSDDDNGVLITPREL